MDFVAVDVETANPDMSSICQIGLASFLDGKLAEQWSSYIDPKDYFHHINIGIHGIDETVVAGAPVLADVAGKLRDSLTGNITVCHTHFDRAAFSQAFSKHQIAPIETTWLDSARVARRTWSEFAWKGYGLHNVCAALGYEFEHHDALEDAKAAGHIMLEAITQTGLDVQAWLKRVKQSINPRASSSVEAIRRKGNPEGSLFGEVVVFTGALEIPRREAADLAASIGCEVASGVTKRTTMLVVGDQDIRKLVGQERSAKHRKAESLIEKGQRITVLRESDFKVIVELE